MKIYLTIPEFIVALFKLDPTQCRLTNSGRIANLHGFAYQIQSLLFERVKVSHMSYRAGTAKLGEESYRSWHGKVSSATARFEINTFIEALTQIEIKHPNQLAAAFGKDEAWSWRWPLSVFLSGVGIFNAIVAYNAPFSNGITYRQFISSWLGIAGMVLLGLIFLFLLAIPLRLILLDSSFLQRLFQTSYDKLVVRAEIFNRIKRLSNETLQRGSLPDIVKLIDEDYEESSDHAIAK